MGRERKIFIRRSGYRDARLFVIATEGEVTEPNYFKSLTDSDLVSSPRIHIEIIPAENGESSPQHVLSNLDEFRREYKIREDDQLWMLIDRDAQSWTQKNLSECQSKCRQKGYTFCLSNPNFEIWILLHIKDHFTETEIQDLLANRRNGSRTYIEAMIININSSYSKTKEYFNSIISKTQTAIVNSKTLTKENKINLFDNVGTNINLLIEELIRTR